MRSDDPKIDASAVECLSQCNAVEDCFPVHSLKISKVWTDAEIVEVQRQVIEVLLQERSSE